MTQEKVKVSDLQLGDIVRLSLDSYGDATVRRINPDGSRQLFRVFVHTDDFSYTGGVGVYTGIEDFAVWPDTDIVRIRRGDPLR